MPRKGAKTPGIFKFNALKKARDSHKRFVRKALDGLDRKYWRRALRETILELEKPVCQEMLDRPIHENVMNTKFDFLRKHDEIGRVKRYKLGKTVFRNEKSNFDKDNIS